MKLGSFAALVMAGAGLCASAMGQAPAGATGVCKDGTYSTAAAKSGACRGHKGVQTWYAATGAAASGTSAGAASGTAATKRSKTLPSTTESQASPFPEVTQAPTPAQRAPASTSPRQGSQGTSVPTAPVNPPSTMPSTTGSQASPFPEATTAPTPAQRSTSSPSAAPRGSIASRPQAAGGGPGLVWVNSSSKVYHCPGSEFYGRTKAGKYESEESAKAEGARADDNKPCTK